MSSLDSATRVLEVRGVQRVVPGENGGDLPEVPMVSQGYRPRTVCGANQVSQIAGSPGRSPGPGRPPRPPDDGQQQVAGGAGSAVALCRVFVVDGDAVGPAEDRPPPASPGRGQWRRCSDCPSPSGRSPAAGPSASARTNTRLEVLGDGVGRDGWSIEPSADVVTARRRGAPRSRCEGVPGPTTWPGAA